MREEDYFKEFAFVQGHLQMRWAMVSLLDLLVKAFIAHCANMSEGLLVFVFNVKTQTKFAFECFTTHIAQWDTWDLRLVIVFISNSIPFHMFVEIALVCCRIIADVTCMLYVNRLFHWYHIKGLVKICFRWHLKTNKPIRTHFNSIHLKKKKRMKGLRITVNEVETCKQTTPK